MDDGQPKQLMARFSYEEVPVLKQEVTDHVDWHHHHWRLQQGAMPIQDGLELLDCLPHPEALFYT